MVRPQYGTQIISQSQPSDIEQLSVKNEQTKYQILPVVDGTEKVTNKCSNGELLKMVHIKPKICDSEKLKQLLEKEQDMEIQDLSSSSEPEEIILDDSGETSDDKGSFLTEIKSKPVNFRMELKLKNSKFLGLAKFYLPAGFETSPAALCAFLGLRCGRFRIRLRLLRN